MRQDKSDRRGDQGFTLVELLVVVTIIGILAAMAVPQFATYKRKATDSEMESDLHHARTAMEAYYEGNGFSYSGATITILENSYGFRATPGVTTVILSASHTDYSLRSCAPNGSYLSYLFDTTDGRILGDDTSC